MATPANARTSSASRSQGGARGRVHLVLIGCNHRTAPVELRERVAFTQEQALHAATELRRQGILQEAVVLSTCNRSELYGVADAESAPVADTLQDFLTSYHGIPRAEIDGRIYRWAGPDALRHLFRVAAGLDSMLLGEAEILGQLRNAYGKALENGSTGPLLNRAFQGALEVGKRVRSETEVGARPMSVALAGVKLAERVFGNLKGRAALVVGAGAVAEQVVEHLRNRGIRSLRVANRSFDRAAELAATMGGEAVAWDALESVLAAPDIIVTSVANGQVLTREMLERALAARGGRPIFVVDLGIPRNVAPGARDLYNLYLYNIDDLGEIVEQNKRAREAEIPRAEAIIAEHVEKFEGWRAGMEAASIVDDLRGRFHEQREALLRARLAEMQGVSPEERERLAAITQELIDQLLREPSERLRSGRGLTGRLAAIEAVRELFALDASDPPGAARARKPEDRE
ncbi:MAG TPA: glutamyl-tRNA reductase [Candidatus Baltobacteraceae bacterium]|nr:glutamyl-tRNA reductase [Candidatus Baltobacteraceae bacterium]